MAEAPKFLSYFGSRIKASSENKTNMEKNSKSSEFEFSIIKLQRYQKEFLFRTHLTKNLAIIQSNM